MHIVYESNDIRIVDGANPDGAMERHIALGRPFNHPQGTIRLDAPAFHVHEFTRHLTYGALCAADGIKRALFLGLGAGIAVQTLRDLVPLAEIDIVDLNRELFEVSDRYFFSLQAQNVHLYHADAFAFVVQAAERYDYIACDIWGPSLEVPPFLLTTDFYENIKRILADAGVFAINTANHVHKHATEQILNRFKRASSLEGNNTFLIGSDNPLVPLQGMADPKILHNLLAINIDVRRITARAIVMQRDGA